uniref:Transporter n=1 Tax=uncultured Thiotrichaceae bacterium TaxID=298394 RepID=A0A6S6TRY2_9GAMM|nr:MAG: Transporter [uncultured Thiotrichaceae bacterium]
MLDDLLTVLGIIFPVFACAGIGLVYGRFFRPDMSVANKLNMDVFVPLLIFWAILDKPFDFSGYTGLAIGGAFIILGSGLLLLPVVVLFKINIKTFLPPAMFNNSGNMGIPLILYAFGEDMLQAAILLFIIEMLLHFTLGIYMLDHKTHPWRLLRMPMIIATLTGLGFSAGGISLPIPLLETVKLLGQIAIPLLLFSLGVRLLDVDFKDWKLGTLGAILGPTAGMICALIILPFIDLDKTQTSVLLLFAVLPPAVLNVLVAEQYQQEPQRVASIVLIGNLASLIIIPVALWFVLIRA